jgi:hypothetical protein
MTLPRLLLAAVLTLAAGCGSMEPGPEERAAADYGPCPDEKDAKKAIETWVRSKLPDPDGSLVKVTGPAEKGWLDGTYGWLSPFTITMNYYDGPGTRAYRALIRDGKVVQAQHRRDHKPDGVWTDGLGARRG